MRSKTKITIPCRINILPKNKYIVLLILIFLSCNKDDNQIMQPVIDCPDKIELGLFNIDESSIGFIPYTESNSKIIFSDSVGNEIIGLITLDTLRKSRNRLPKDYLCEQDSTQTYAYFYDREFREVILVIEEIDVRVNLNLTVFVNRGDQYQIEPADTLFIFDHFKIDLRTPIIDTSSINPPLNFNSFVVIVNSGNHPASTSSPSVEVYNLDGNNYSDIYFGNPVLDEDEFKILYNAEYGLIGLENSDRSISLKYEYIE